MNKNSNKNRLSKNLKYISIASAITLCASISGPVSEASANPLRNLWTRFTSFFSSSSSTNSNSRLNRPSSNATTSSSSAGNSNLWNKFKSQFTSKTSSANSNVTSTSNLKTTDLDDPKPTTSPSLWNRFKGVFTGGSKTSSDKNKSGVTNHSYTVDSDSDGEFNPKFDDQNLKNLRFVISSSGSGTLSKINLSDKTSTGSSTGIQQPTVKTSSQTSSSGSSGVQYADLDFTGQQSTGIIHGSDDKTIYATIKTGTNGKSPQTPVPQVPPKTYKSKLGSATGGGIGKPPIPTPRKNSPTPTDSVSSSSSSSPSRGILVGKGPGFESRVINDDVIITTTNGGNQTQLPLPSRSADLDKNTTTTSGSTSPKTLTSRTSSSTVTINDKSTSDNNKPKMVTFNFDQK